MGMIVRDEGLFTRIMRGQRGTWGSISCNHTDLCSRGGWDYLPSSSLSCNINIRKHGLRPCHAKIIPISWNTGNIKVIIKVNEECLFWLTFFSWLIFIISHISFFLICYYLILEQQMSKYFIVLVIEIRYKNRNNRGIRGRFILFLSLPL